MKIDNLNMEDIKNIEFNYDNLEILKIIKYLLSVVLNDIYFMNDENDIDNNEIKYLDLGNNKKIKKEDIESIYSFIDTLYFIIKYNKESE